MNKAIARVIYLLAAGNVTRSEIRELHEWIASHDSDELYIAIREIQKELGTSKSSYGVKKSGYSSASGGDRSYRRGVNVKRYGEKYSSFGELYDSLSVEVEDILRNDLGLSTSEAVRRITNQLSKEVDRDLIPQLGKRSFRSWIARLSKLVPPSVIMQAVMTIRNQETNSGNWDWPLKGRE